MFDEHRQIVLTADVTGDGEEELKTGDVGTIIHVHPGRQAFVVEFMTLDGENRCDCYRAAIPGPSSLQRGHDPRSQYGDCGLGVVLRCRHTPRVQ